LARTCIVTVGNAILNNLLFPYINLSLNMGVDSLCSVRG
jgi:hypothetical protein